MNHQHFASAQDIQLQREMRRIARRSLFVRRLLSVCLILALMAIFAGSAWFLGRTQAARDADRELSELKALLQEETEITPGLNLNALYSEIQDIGELATVEYLFTDAAQFTNSKQFQGWDIPFTEKSFLLRWNGVIKAGIPLDQVSVQIQEGKKRILVSVPAAQILSCQIDTDSVEVLDEQNSLFNSISVDDKIQLDVATEQAMKDRAIESGLLEKAQQNAQDLLTRLICSYPQVRDKYTISFTQLS